MGYQVLARKWRPKSFREMVGQEHVLRTLSNALDHDRLHHAYLFTGTRGVGKTTIARILAKCLNCETKVSSHPCGQCGACIEIDEGRFVDLIEVDAASRTKVEDTRELLENVQYAPTRGRYKVYLIDEVHMLSSHSFNALLKTLEEPPPHVKFLLATTDPQKLPVTILSRCLQFSLKNMPAQRIVEHLSGVLAKEEIQYEEAALWEIGRAADGSVRDAMSLTDQAIAFGNGKLIANDVRAMLGTIDRAYVIQLIEAIAKEDVQGALGVVEEASLYSPDYNGILAELISTFHRIAIAQAIPLNIDNSVGDAEKIAQLAQLISPEDVQLFYQTALVGRKDLPLNPDGKAGLEMIVLRILLFRPIGSKPRGSKPNGNESLPKNDSVGGGESAIAGAASLGKSRIASEYTLPGTISSEASREGRDKVKRARALLMNAQNDKFENKSATLLEDLNAPAIALSRRTGSVSTGRETRVEGDASTFEFKVTVASESRINVVDVKKSELTAEKASPHISNDGYQKNAEPGSEVAVAQFVKHKFEVEDEWCQLIFALGIDGNLLNMVRNCGLESREKNHFKLHLDKRHEALLNNDRVQRLQNVLAVYLKAAATVDIVLAQPTGKTPDQLLEDIKQQKLQVAKEIIVNDCVVQSLQSRFHAVIDQESIRSKM